MENFPLRRKKTAFVILVTATIAFALAIIPGIWIAVMSMMIFDSGVTTILIILYSFIATFPLICFLSFISWVFYDLRKYWFAVFISLMPVLNPVGFAVMLAIKNFF